MAVLVLNWNGRALTEACLASWMLARPRPKRLLVVDNGSSDGSVAFLKRRFPGLEILALPSNLGFAAGNNRGFEYLRQKGPAVEAVFVCNNDTEVEPDMLGALWRVFERRPQWGAAGPRIDFHGSGKIWFEGGLVHAWTGRGIHRSYGADSGPAGAPLELPEDGFVTGCGLLVRSGVLKDLNGFDESFWAYSEDADLCLRMARLGLRCGVVPAARMSHKISASFTLDSPRSRYYETRNHYIVLRRYGLGFGLPTRAAYAAVSLFRMARALARGKPPLAKALARGLLDGMRKRTPLFEDKP